MLQKLTQARDWDEEHEINPNEALVPVAAG